jgi:hypothetical protein
MEGQKNRERRELGAVSDEWVMAAARVTEECKLCRMHPHEPIVSVKPPHWLFRGLL